MSMTLDEFFEMAQFGGQIKACHDIFEILNNKDYTPEEISQQLNLYQLNVTSEFKKASLKFKMNDGKVDMSADSIESLE